MNTYNEFADRNLDIGEQLTKRNFWFLVDDYHFAYSNYSFRSDNIHIEMQIGHKVPSIIIYRVGEPDFMRLLFDRILQYFEGSISDQHIDFTYRSLAENMIWYADKFQKHSHKIIDKIDDWWLPVQVFQYNLMKKEYEDAGQLEGFLKSYKRKHDYLKSKGAI